MSLLPLFLQVRAATPTPPTSGSTSTPPPTADGGTPPHDASTDASVSTDAAVPDATPADAGSRTPTPPTTSAAASTSTPRTPETPRSSPSSPIQVQVDPSFYISAGACYTGRGFGNQREDYHDGGCFQLTAGFPTLRFGESFYVRPELRGQLEWVNHVIRPDHGGPVSSSASVSTLGGLVVVGWQPIPYFYAELGGLLGASYFESHAPENGEGGTFVANNALGVSLHNWGLNYGAVLRLGLPEQRLGDIFALGFGVEGSVSHTDLSVVPDWTDRNPNDPPEAVGSTSVSVGAFLRVRFGSPSSSTPSSSGGSSSSSTESSRTSSGSSSTPTDPPSTGTSTGSTSGSSSPESSGSSRTSSRPTSDSSRSGSSSSTTTSGTSSPLSRATPTRHSGGSRSRSSGGSRRAVGHH